MSSKPALDRGHIHTLSRPQQLATSTESRERLVDRRAGAKMQELLGAYGSERPQAVRSSSAKWLRLGVHGSPSVINDSVF